MSAVSGHVCWIDEICKCIPLAIANDLHKRPSRVGRHPVLAAVSGFLCLVVLLCGTLAANEKWHNWFHSHSDGTEDPGSCAVCLLASGGWDQPTVEAPYLVTPLGVLRELTAPATPLVPVGFRQEFRGRGPPDLADSLTA